MGLLPEIKMDWIGLDIYQLNVHNVYYMSPRHTLDVDVPWRRPWWSQIRCGTAIECYDDRYWRRSARRRAAARISAAGEAASGPSEYRRQRSRTWARRRLRSQAGRLFVPSSCDKSPTRRHRGTARSALAACFPSKADVTNNHYAMSAPKRQRRATYMLRCLSSVSQPVTYTRPKSYD